MKSVKNLQPVQLTKDGLNTLKAELNELKKVKLPDVVERIATARAEGDLSENSSYIFGKQEQEFIEGRIAELEEILANASVIAQNGNVKKSVGLGCKVVVSIGGKKMDFYVVGEWEAKPAERKISGSSPLGKALLGKKIGEKVEVEAPAGKVLYTIIGIE